jgi:hypothetical protein
MAVYREDQSFAWWSYVLVGAMALITVVLFSWFRQAPAAGVNAPSGLGRSLFLLVGVGLPAILLLGVLRMTTLVVPGEVRVWFGWIPTFRRNLAITSIERVEVVQFRPIVDHGGWGVRWARDGERVFTAKGNRGVRLYLHDGSRILIGSQRPEELARLIDRAVRNDGLLV